MSSITLTLIIRARSIIAVIFIGSAQSHVNVNTWNDRLLLSCDQLIDFETIGGIAHLNGEVQQRDSPHHDKRTVLFHFDNPPSLQPDPIRLTCSS